MDDQWAGLALRARKRGKEVVEKVARLIAEETHQRVCDEVQMDWFLKTHSRRYGLRIDKMERNRDNFILLPAKEETEMYP